MSKPNVPMSVDTHRFLCELVESFVEESDFPLELWHAIVALDDCSKDYSAYEQIRKEMFELGNTHGWDRQVEFLIHPDLKDDLEVKTPGQLISSLRKSAIVQGDKVTVNLAEYNELVEWLENFEPEQ
jgi:hypothetical protein